ncbi:MAG TPA: hypothetical protein DD640_08215 [Clostridiales bacterium]|nr:hypothetical protein [Clostridiales bacterium]
MKLNKKILVPLSIILGVALLASTAYAETVTRSAYDQLKDAVKTTSAQMSNEIDNYTVRTTFTLTDNDTVLMRKTSGQKVDGDKNESRETTETKNGQIQSSYNYNDGLQYIWYDSYSDTYYVNEYMNAAWKEEIDGVVYDDYNRDPLAQEQVADLERILDAFVGNLRNYITVTSDEDNSKTFTGTLSDTQIPAIVNAVASFLTKQFLGSSLPGMQPMATSGIYPEDARTDEYNAGEYMADQQQGFDQVILKGDVFIKYLAGTAKADPQGLLTSATFNIVLSGRDADGAARDLAFDVTMDLTSVGTTSLSKPDLTGKNVVVNKVDNGFSRQDKLSDKFVGTYRNDIVADQGDSFAKIGERTLVIESIDQDQVTGRYYETYVDGSDYEPIEFSFTAPNNDPYSVSFTYEDGSGRTGSGSIYFDMNASIQLQLDKNMGSWASPYFPRVFD